MTFCMVWVSFNAQQIANEAVMQALNTIAEMEVVTETTTTQAVEGDSAIINNAEFEQFNDSSVNGDGSFAEVANSRTVFKCEKSFAGAKTIHSNKFTFKVKAGESYRVFS